MNMATSRWEPLRDLLALQDRMSRLFEDVTRTRRSGDEEDMTAAQWTPAVDIFETPQSLVIRAEVPGIEQEALNVELKENSLIVEGERKLEEGEGWNYHRVERPYGSFRRVVALPMAFRHEQIQALLKNGVLEITLLKEEKTKPTRIQVEARQ
jgi:HSP20 family protein